MLTAIEFKNMKGQSGIQELTGMDIFVGRNGAGKTTRLQALGIAMLGYVPGNKKTSADTFKLATGDTMSVGLKTERLQLTRSFVKSDRRNGQNGSVTTSIKENITLSPGAGERTDTEKDIRIKGEIGNFPVMMDFSEFLSLSDAKRRDFIYGLGIESRVWDREQIDNYLHARLLTMELQSNNLEQYEAMAQLLNKAVAEFPEGFGVQEGLQAMIDWVDTEKKIWTSKQKDAQGAVRQISDMKNEMAETDRNIAACKTDLENLHNQLIGIEKLITADMGKKKAIDKRTGRMIELQKAVLELESKPGNADTSEIDRQIVEHQQQLVEPPVVDTNVAALKDRQAEIRRQRKIVDAQHNTLSNEISAIRATVIALEDALKATNTLAGRCIINPELIKCDKDFSKFGDHVDIKKNDAATKVADLQEQDEVLKRQLNALDKEDTDIMDKQAALLRTVQEVNTRNASINKSITKLTQQKNERLMATADRENKIKIYREELDRILNEPVEPVTGTELLEKQAVGIRSRIEELKKTIEEKEKAKQSILLLQQSVMDNRKAEYNSICLKLINEALGPKGIQGEIVKESLEPIRLDIQRNLSLMGFAHEPFFQTESDTGKEVFQFGWINEKGHHVNFDALSTGQQTVFLAAMMITIIDRAQPKLRILAMDNLNHLDRRNFQMLVSGLTQIKDKLHNIILAGAIEFDFAAEGWRVFDLSPEPVPLDADYTVIDDREEVKRSA